MAKPRIKLAIPTTCPACKAEFLAGFEPIYHTADFLARLPEPQRSELAAEETRLRAKYQAMKDEE